MIKHTDQLSMVEFHAYVDSQLSDEQYENIERRLLDAPDTITHLQNCLLINERLQACFSGPDIMVNSNTEAETDAPALSSSDRLEYVPPEPALGNVDELEISDNVAQESYAEIDSLDLHEQQPLELELEPEIETILPSRTTEASIPELTIPENTTETFESDQEIPPELSAHHAEPAAPPVLTHSAYDDAANANTTAAEDDIDVDNFLKGINETHMIDNNISPMRHDSLSKDIFSSAPPFASSPSFVDKIRGGISSLVTKLKNRRGAYHHQNPPLAVESDTDASMDEFEIDIDEAMQSTPKLRFWRFRMQHAADDAIDSVKGQLEPITPTVSPWLSKINFVLATIGAQLRRVKFINELMNQSYWVLGGMVTGLIIGAWLFASNSGLSKADLELMAIDSHLYFSEQGANIAEAGTDDFEKNMQWLKQSWGRRVSDYDVSDNSKFRKKGALLLPTIDDYASVQIFENFNSERITLYVSHLAEDVSENTRIRCHIASKVDGVCNWTQDSLSFFAVGNLSLSRVRHFSSLIAAQR